MRRHPILIASLPFALALIACQVSSLLPGYDDNPPPPDPAESQPTATHTSAPPTPTEAPSLTPTTPPAPDPQPVEFTTADNVTLVGTYFPPPLGPAPVVVMMHWAGGDQMDWYGDALEWPRLALIMQSRGYAVLTFNFRGFPPSGTGPFNVTYLDAQAAVQFATTLDGADPERVLTIGASIGADGAVDGCQVNGASEPPCLAAISLSPGNYIGLNYVEAVSGAGGIPVACITAEGDPESAPTCEFAGAALPEQVRTIFYPGSSHGMMLFLDTPQDPVLLDFILDFFEGAVVGAGG